jgi:sugar/nucleoside kinase (ribokinase family)
MPKPHPTSDTPHPTSYDIVTVGSLFVELTPTTPGETLAGASAYTLVAGGAATNVVFALARLGARVGFLTAVGDDEFADFLAGELAAFGVDDAGMRRVAGQLTPVSFAAMDQRGGKTFRFYRFPGYCNPMAALTEENFAPATRGRLFDFSEGAIRDAGLRPLVFAAARACRRADVPTAYAMNLRRAAWGLPDAEIIAAQREAVALADIVVLNAEEMDYVAGDLDALLALGPRVAVVTAGGEGAIRVRVGDEEVAVPPYRVPCIYDIGAGDTFHAGLMAAVLRHDVSAMALADWAAAARVGAAAAAIRVSTSADPHDLPTWGEVAGWMEGRA